MTHLMLAQLDIDNIEISNFGVSVVSVSRWDLLAQFYQVENEFVSLEKEWHQVFI